jgi:hypothetical protein
LDVKPEVVAVEKRVCSYRYSYAGTLDLLAVIQGRKVLIDWKASAGASAVYQLAGYALALEECGETVTRGATVILGEDGRYTMSATYDLDRATREFPALRLAHGVRARLGVAKQERDWK